MQIMVLSSKTGGCVGILRISKTEVAVYDPVSNRKKYVFAGVEGNDEMATPKHTTTARTAITPTEGALVYDTDTKKLYLGDGSTAGGVELLGEIDDRVDTLENLVTGLETALAGI